MNHYLVVSPPAHTSCKCHVQKATEVNTSRLQSLSCGRFLSTYFAHTHTCLHDSHAASYTQKLYRAVLSARLEAIGVGNTQKLSGRFQYSCYTAFGHAHHQFSEQEQILPIVLSVRGWLQLSAYTSCPNFTEGCYSVCHPTPLQHAQSHQLIYSLVAQAIKHPLMPAHTCV